MSEAVEGRNAVAELLRSGAPVQMVLLVDGAGTQGLGEIEALARAARVPVERRSRGELDAMSGCGSHQGVIALVAPFRYVELADLLRRAEGSAASLIVVLDHITDAGNLGAIARSAEVVGAEGLVVAKKRAAAIGAGAWKASAGALAHLPVARVPNLVRALEDLKRSGYWVAGASEHASTVAWDAPLEGRIALVVGSESEGLARLTEETCDLLVRLPTSGRIGSLNVAQAATVLMYEWARRSAR